MVAPGLQQVAHADADAFFVVDQQQRTARIDGRGHGVGGDDQVVHLVELGGLDQDAEHRAPPRCRHHLELVAHQQHQPLDDGQAHAEAARAVAAGVADLVELVEHLGQLLFGDADAGVPHLDADGTGPCAGHDHDAAFLRVADGVVDQVAQHALQQVRVAHHDLAAGLEAHAQAQLFGLAGAVHVQHAEQVADGKRLQVGLDHAGVELGDVEHRGERLLQRVDGADHVLHQRLQRRVDEALFQRGGEEAQRVHRLAQVVAGGGEEAALLAVGLFDQKHLLAQRAHQRVVVELGLQLLHQQAVPGAGEEGTGHEEGRGQRCDGERERRAEVEHVGRQRAQQRQQPQVDGPAVGRHQVRTRRGEREHEQHQRHGRHDTQIDEQQAGRHAPAQRQQQHHDQVAPQPLRSLRQCHPAFTPENPYQQPVQCLRAVHRRGPDPHARTGRPPDGE